MAFPHVAVGFLQCVIVVFSDHIHLLFRCPSITIVYNKVRVCLSVPGKLGYFLSPLCSPYPLMCYQSLFYIGLLCCACTIESC